MTLLVKFKVQNELRRKQTALEQPHILFSPVHITRKGMADVWPLSIGTAGHAAPSQVSHKEMFAARATLSHSPADSEWGLFCHRLSA